MTLLIYSYIILNILVNILVRKENKMIALVTGASSGIGRDIARYLSNLDYDLIITSRNVQPK